MDRNRLAIVTAAAFIFIWWCRRRRLRCECREWS